MSGRLRDGSQPRTVLIVDDDDGMRDTLVAVLADRYRCFTAESAEQALAIVATAHVDLLLVDVRLPGMNGIELVGRVKADLPDLEVIVLSVLSDIDVAIRAIKAGAFHYIIKDFQYETLHALLANACEKQDLRRMNAALQDQIAAVAPPTLIGGLAPGMGRLLALVDKVGPMEMPLLITGETGTGKTLLARYVHARAARGGPFIEASMSEPVEAIEHALLGDPRVARGVPRRRGKLELAAGGTLFLDEVADLPPTVQARLVRLLQEEHDVRLIGATRRDLARLAEDGSFREDLYYRLCVVPLHLPPLRERVEDLPALANHFLAAARRRHGRAVCEWMPDAIEALQQHDWPGNVRELASLVERLMLLHDDPVITARHLPMDLQLPQLRAHTHNGEARSFMAAVTLFERRLLVKALERADGNLASAARDLAMPLSTLKYKVRRYGLRAGAPPVEAPEADGVSAS